MTNTFDKGQTEFLINVAKDAGSAIMELHNIDLKVKHKIDNSPVTEADERAEKIIRLALKKHFPDIPFIGEEGYSSGERPDTSRGMFWLVDALDGTKEFIEGRHEFTVNIALIKFGHPIFGIVHAPARKETYWGSHAGAFKEKKGNKRQAIQTREPDKNGLTVTLSHSHRTGEEEYLKDFNIKQILRYGSSLKFCLIASGEADLYPRLGNTSEWDTAAGHAVLLFAGGRMTRLDGGAFLYGKKDIINSHFVASGYPTEEIKAQ